MNQLVVISFILVLLFNQFQVISTESSPFVFLRHKTINIRNEESKLKTLMKREGGVETLKRSHSTNQKIQIIVHLTQTRFIEDLKTVCQAHKAQYIPDNSYVLLCSLSSLSTLNHLPYVDYFDTYNVEYKTNGKSVQLEEKEEEEEDKQVSYVIQLAPGFSSDKTHYEMGMESLKQTLKPFNAMIEAIQDDSITVQVSLKFVTQMIEAVTQLDFCHWVEKNPEAQTDNKDVRGLVQSGVASNYKIESYKVTGKNVVIGVTDVGLDFNHCYFYSPATFNICFRSNPNSTACLYPNTQHRKLVGYYAFADAVDNSGHGTHVAATAAGFYATTPTNSLVTSNIGVAKDSKIAFFDYQNTFSSLLPSFSTVILPFFKRMGANIVTNSYSSATDEPGSYTLTTSDIDSYTYQNQDMLVLFSASNNGPSYGSISSFSVNKNGLSVGSVEKALTFSSYSSSGFSDDGRIKPDLLAPGSGVSSAKRNSGNLCNSQTILTTQSGTSSSTPAVAGSAALITQYYVEGQMCGKNLSCAFQPSGALIKATLINSAQHLQESWFVGAGIEHTGFGRIKLDDVLDFTGKKLVVFDRVSLLPGSNFSTQVTPTLAGSFSIVLAWFDPAASPTSSITLVNDLDLVVVSPTGQKYFGNEYLGILQDRKDNRNNVEKVLIPREDLVAGPYTVYVMGASINQGAFQNFSLVINRESINTCRRCGRLRLVDGPSKKEGRVEMLRGGSWYNVCGLSTNIKTASVICRHLGFPKSDNHFIYRNLKYGRGSNTMNVWNRTLSCSGSETNLFDCAVASPNPSCNHDNDISVSCDCPAPHVWDGDKCIINYSKLDGQQTFTTGPLSQTIPDGSLSLTSAINVAGVNMVPSIATTSVIVETFITHPVNQEVIISLTSPYSTYIALTSNRGGLYRNGFNGTQWRDDSVPSAKLYQFTVDGVVPYLNPETPLSSLLYSPSFNGLWTLTVYDSKFGNVGTLNGWRITFKSVTNNCVRGVPDSLGNKSCDCSGTGYTGSACEVDINECDLNPCGSNSICNNTPGGYTCACAPGFVGNGFNCL